MLFSCTICPSVTQWHGDAHKDAQGGTHKQIPKYVNTHLWRCWWTPWICCINHMQSCSHTHSHMQTCWCENSEHVRPFTLHSDPQTEDYTEDNPCVCLPVCPFIPPSYSPSLCVSCIPKPATPDQHLLPSVWANERSASEVCLNDRYCVITSVTVSLLSVHNCYRQPPNHMALKHWTLLFNTNIHCAVIASHTKKWSHAVTFYQHSMSE